MYNMYEIRTQLNEILLGLLQKIIYIVTNWQITIVLCRMSWVKTWSKN